MTAPRYQHLLLETMSRSVPAMELADDAPAAIGASSTIRDFLPGNGSPPVVVGCERVITTFAGLLTIQTSVNDTGCIARDGDASGVSLAVAVNAARGFMVLTDRRLLGTAGPRVFGVTSVGQVELLWEILLEEVTSMSIQNDHEGSCQPADRSVMIVTRSGSAGGVVSIGAIEGIDVSNASTSMAEDLSSAMLPVIVAVRARLGNAAGSVGNASESAFVGWSVDPDDPDGLVVQFSSDVSDTSGSRDGAVGAAALIDDVPTLGDALPDGDGAVPTTLMIQEVPTDINTASSSSQVEEDRQSVDEQQVTRVRESARLELCVTCGAEMSADDRFCGDCGTMVAVVGRRTYFCPSCDVTIMLSDEYCPGCGQALTMCPTGGCGAVMTVAASFCSRCGVASLRSAHTPVHSLD